ncbi:hypothetical protein DAI22_02g172000 [Oryza sativa Japonica Group]|nr:hypothetical protein DAI22_02g172000 [Oryza sativa Japonica Group]
MSLEFYEISTVPLPSHFPSIPHLFRLVPSFSHHLPGVKPQRELVGKVTSSAVERSVDASVGLLQGMVEQRSWVSSVTSCSLLPHRGGPLRPPPRRLEEVLEVEQRLVERALEAHLLRLRLIHRAQRRRHRIGQPPHATAADGLGLARKPTTSSTLLTASSPRATASSMASHSWSTWPTNPTAPSAYAGSAGSASAASLVSADTRRNAARRSSAGAMARSMRAHHRLGLELGGRRQAARAPRRCLRVFVAAAPPPPRWCRAAGPRGRRTPPRTRRPRGPPGAPPQLPRRARTRGGTPLGGAPPARRRGRCGRAGRALSPPGTAAERTTASSRSTSPPSSSLRRRRRTLAPPQKMGEGSRKTEKVGDGWKT